MTDVVECYGKVAELANALGISSINTLVGCWKHQIDDRWHITVNGHDAPFEGLGPFEMLVEFNGWPSGIVHPTRGGVIADGQAANEDAFIAALDAAIRRAQE